MTTLEFCTSGHHEITGIGASPVADAPWQVASGAAPGIITSGAGCRTGGRAYQWDTTGGATHGYRQRAATGTEKMGQFYVTFPTLPSGDCVFYALVPSVGTFVHFRFIQATSEIVASIGANEATRMAVVAGTTYRIDFKYLQTGGTTHTVTWSVNGVAKGAATLAQAVATLVSWRFGISCISGTNVTGKTAIRDIQVGPNSADYPMAESIVDACLLTGDGTHDFAAGAYKYSTGTDVALAAIDTYSFLNHRLANISDFIRLVNPLAGKYIENTISGMPAADSINGLQATVGFHAAGVNANKITVRLRDTGTDSDICTDFDCSQTSGMVYFSKHYAVRPAALGAWTVAAINALRFRTGSSWTAPDVADEPRLDGLVVEVSYVPSSAAVVFEPVGLRFNLAVPLGLSGFDKTVSPATEGRRTNLRLGVPTFRVENPDTGPGTVDADFTAESVLEAARDRHASFDHQRHPSPILLRFLDRYQRHLLAQALERDTGFMVSEHVITFPLGTGTRDDFVAGYSLPFVYHLLLGGEAVLNGLRPGVEFNIVAYGRRHDAIPFYGGWVLGPRLYFHGDLPDWAGVTSVRLSYVPTVPRLSSLRGVLSLPRTAELAMVESVAAFMAGRGHHDPQLPALDQGAFIRRAALAEDAWLTQIGNRRRTQVAYVREVW